MPPSRTVTPVTLVGAVAVALLVVGAGAAIGMGTRSSGHHPSAGVITSETTTTAASGRSSSPTSTGSAAAVTTTTSAGGSRPVPVIASSTSTTAAPTSGPASSPTTASVSGSTPTTAAAASTDLTPVGTYKYSTSGQSKLLGKTYDYPATTTIGVTTEGCGIASKWTSSPGNSTTTVECPAPGGIHIVSQDSQVSAGGENQSMTFTCAADSFVPTSGTPGQTWTWTCSSTGSNGTETTTQLVTLIGPKTTTVGGTAVTVEQVSVDSTLSGPEKGTVKMTYWLTSDATPVYETGTIDASEYGISYTSNYTLRLDSLTPTQ